jgi:hypothetical protein
MPRLGKNATSTGIGALGEPIPIAPLLCQAVGTEAPQQHIVWSGVVGVEFNAIALEALYRACLAIDGDLFLGTNGESEHRQAAVLRPKLCNASVDALVRFDKAPGCCVRPWMGGQQHTDDEYQKPDKSPNAHQVLQISLLRICVNIPRNTRLL